MKRIFCLVLAGILLLCTACHANPASSTTDTTSSASSVSSSASTPTSSPSSGTQSTASAVSTPDATPTPAPTSAPESLWEETGVAGMEQLSVALPNAPGARMTVRGGCLLYEFIQPGMDSSSEEYWLVDSVSGQTLHSDALPDGRHEIGLLQNGYFVADLDAGTVEIIPSYDSLSSSSLGLLLDFKQPLTNVILNRDGTFALYTLFDGKVRLYDVWNDTEIPVSKTVYLNEPCLIKDDAFYFYDMERKTYCLKSSGDCFLCDERQNATLIGSYYVESYEDQFYIRYIDSVTPLSFAADVDKEQVITSTRRYLVTMGDRFIKLYDLENEKATDPIAVPGDYCLSVAFSDDSQSLYLLTGENNDTFSALRLTVPDVAFPQTFSLSADSYEELDKLYEPWHGDEETALAQKILDTYNVRVIFESERLEDNLYLYVSDTADWDKVLPTLQEIDKFLALLPQGLTQEIGDGNEIWVYLGKNLRQEDADGNIVKQIGGVAGTQFGVSLIGLDTGYNASLIAGTFAHEMTHVFDRHIPQELIDEYEALSPAGSYYNSYTVYFDRDSNASLFNYTPYDASTELYFVDEYARTFSTEDRARCIEFAYDDYIGLNDRAELLSQPNIQAKLKKFYSMMRASYASCANEEMLFLEEYVK